MHVWTKKGVFLINIKFSIWVDRFKLYIKTKLIIIHIKVIHIAVTFSKILEKRSENKTENKEPHKISSSYAKFCATACFLLRSLKSIFQIFINQKTHSHIKFHVVTYFHYSSRFCSFCTIKYNIKHTDA